MPIKHAIWTVGDKPTPLPVTRLETEQLLEDMIENDPRILSEQWMLIGRQEHTPTGGRIDLLAIAPDASLVLIELKRDKTPRDIVAQALDYATWVQDLKPDRIAQIYRNFSNGKPEMGSARDAARDGVSPRILTKIDCRPVSYIHVV
jgi:RecB family endonuclease NucS